MVRPLAPRQGAIWGPGPPVFGFAPTFIKVSAKDYE